MYFIGLNLYSRLRKLGHLKPTVHPNERYEYTYGKYLKMS